MVRTVAVMLLLCLTPSASVGVNDGRRVVLPNSRLVGCAASACSQLWQEIAATGESVYPMNLSIDVDRGAVLGIQAHYDKSVPYANVKAAIDERYAKWSFVQNVWRVEPEKIAIQLSTDDDGSSRIIYLSANAWKKKQ